MSANACKHFVLNPDSRLQTKWGKNAKKKKKMHDNNWKST